MKKILYLLSAILITFASCGDSFDSSYAEDAEMLPAATYMDTDETHAMSLWVDLLRYTKMYSTMNLNNSYTCFVPDNDAFKAYLDSKKVSSVDQLDMEEAVLLVRYHTIAGKKYSSVDFEDGLVADSTASGDYLSTSFLENGGMVRINMEASIKNTVQVTNGYIHTIDAMLTPVDAPIWGELQKTGNYSIISQALKNAGIDEILNSPIKSHKYTLFAVPDAVYAKAGISNVSDLMKYIGAKDTDGLTQYLMYHLVDQQLSYSTLSDFAQDDKVRSKNYNTMAEYQLINVSEVNKTLLLNYNKSEEAGVKLTQINKNCKNGVIHTIDGVMPVAIPQPSVFKWDFTDYSELTIIPNYRTTPGTNSSTYPIFEELQCYQWQSVPEFRLGLAYYIPAKGDAVRTKALNKDYLMLSLGDYGWVEMESPAILAGKYKVYLEHFNPKAAEKAGRLSFILDDNYLGSQIATIGASAKTDQFLKTQIGEVDFSTTMKHKLRILAGDNQSAYIDCLTFEPITK